MTRALAIAAAAALMAAFLMPTAQAQQPMPLVCQPHAKIKQELNEKYNEVLVAMGLAGRSLLEIYAGKSGGFTIVLMRPEMGGLACIQGAGTDFVLTGNKFPPAKADPA